MENVLAEYENLENLPDRASLQQNKMYDFITNEVPDPTHSTMLEYCSAILYR